MMPVWSDLLSRVNSSKRLVRIAGSNYFRDFFCYGSRQLKLNWASLPDQGAECNSRLFFQLPIDGMIKREKLGDQKRLPRF